MRRFRGWMASAMPSARLSLARRRSGGGASMPAARLRAILPAPGAGGAAPKRNHIDREMAMHGEYTCVPFPEIPSKWRSLWTTLWIPCALGEPTTAFWLAACPPMPTSIKFFGKPSAIPYYGTTGSAPASPMRSRASATSCPQVSPGSPCSWSAASTAKSGSSTTCAVIGACSWSTSPGMSAR